MAGRKLWIILGTLVLIAAGCVAAWYALVHLPEQTALRSRVKALIEEGTEFRTKKDLSNAQLKFKEALKLDPESDEALLALARCEISAYRFNDAIKRLNDLGARDNTEATQSKVNRYLGEAYLGRYGDTRANRDFLHASANLERAKAAPEHRPRALASLGLLYLIRASEGQGDSVDGPAKKVLEYWRELKRVAADSDEFREIREQFENLERAFSSDNG